MAAFFKTMVMIIGLVVTDADCGQINGPILYEREAMAGKRIEEALAEHTPALMSLPGVVGTAQGFCDNQPCIVIYVIQKTPELEQKIPSTLEGFPTRIEETGEIRALPKK